MTRYARKKGQNTPHRYRINKTKNYSYTNPAQVEADRGDEDLPGHGQHYCTVCSRHFVSEDVLVNHKKSNSQHKKILRRQIKEDAEEERMSDLMKSGKRKSISESNDIEMNPTEKKAKVV
ncbi:hypothetical protein HDE_09098 [Halotydeus destructor]|nr:hypothetical protein HDE_09098 [Halotydeus destructor]